MISNDNTFRPIKDFPWYLACRDGYVINSDTGHIMQGSLKKTGYVEIVLTDAEGLPHYRLLHRIIAEAFCEKAEGQSEVNHINGRKTDNRAENLEWVTRAENLRHAYETGLMPNNAVPKPVIAKNMDTGEEMAFPSIYKAARFFNISQGNICMCCKGERPYANGYFWQYDEQKLKDEE